MEYRTGPSGVLPSESDVDAAGEVAIGILGGFTDVEDLASRAGACALCPLLCRCHRNLAGAASTLRVPTLAGVALAPYLNSIVKVIRIERRMPAMRRTFRHTASHPGTVVPLELSCAKELIPGRSRYSSTTQHEPTIGNPRGYRRLEVTWVRRRRVGRASASSSRQDISASLPHPTPKER